MQSIYHVLLLILLVYLLLFFTRIDRELVRVLCTSSRWPSWLKALGEVYFLSKVPQFPLLTDPWEVWFWPRIVVPLLILVSTCSCKLIVINDFQSSLGCHVNHVSWYKINVRQINVGSQPSSIIGQNFRRPLPLLQKL